MTCKGLEGGEADREAKRDDERRVYSQSYCMLASSEKITYQNEMTNPSTKAFAEFYCASVAVALAFTSYLAHPHTPKSVRNKSFIFM